MKALSADTNGPLGGRATGDIPATAHLPPLNREDSIQMDDSGAPSPKAKPARIVRDNLFLIFITLTQLVSMIPLGAGISTGLIIGKSLGTSDLQSVWVVASYPLTQGSFVLIGGRLGAVYGHKTILALGCVWWTVWAFAGGYANNIVALCLMRGLCGVGGGLMTPNVVALIGISFPPGRKRNLGFALFGAMAPVGAAGGSLVAAIVVQLGGWRWLFLMLGLLGFVVYGTALVAIDADKPMDPHGQIDWIGAYLGVAALVLFNFVWNQAASAGWSNPYEITLLVFSILHFAVFCYWEMHVAREPILPFNIWKAPRFGHLMAAIFFSFMSLGIYFWYMNCYMQVIRGDSPIRTGVQYLPLTLVGTANAFLSAWLVPRLPAQAIIGMGCLAMIATNVLLAVVPRHLTYWAICFPAMLVSAFTLDLITASAQIITSGTVSMKHQGVAGSLVGTLMSYGMSTGLGFAGTVEVHTFDNGHDLLRGYHSAAYLAVGFAVAALVLTLFIRIPKDRREGWGEEDQQEAADRQAGT